MSTPELEITTDDRLMPAAEIRRQFWGDITPMTEWRWEQKFDDFPPWIYINKRKYMTAKNAVAFIQRRAEQTPVATADGAA